MSVRYLVGVMAVIAVCAAPASAQSGWQPLGPSFPNVSVVDQDGKTYRLRDDLVSDRVVVINFVFTTCTTICGPQTAIFRSLQQQAEKRGVPLTLLSITLAPEQDTPEVLKAFAKEFDAGPGWHFLTGDPQSVVGLVSRLGVLAGDDPSTHAPVALVVNGRTGQWTRTSSIAPVGELLQLVDAASRLGATNGGR